MNAEAPIYVNSSENMTEVRLEQPLKAEMLICVTDGILAVLRLEHPKNASLLMDVTLLGISTEARLEHPKYVEVFDCQLYAVNTIER